MSQRPRTRAKQAKTSEQQEALDHVAETVRSLSAEYDPLWGSLVKQTVRRVYPGFNETAYGYSSFSELLEDAAKQGLLELEFDKERGNYKVRPKD